MCTLVYSKSMKKNSSILLIFLATIGYGFVPLFTLIAYAAAISSIELAFLRFTGSCLLMWLFYILQGKITSLFIFPMKTITQIILTIGVPFTCAILTKFIAFTTMPIGVVQAVFYGYPLLVMVVRVSSGQEKLYYSRLIGYLIILLGILLTLDFSDSRITFIGVLFSIMSPLTYTFYMLNIKNKSILPVPSPIITTYVMSTGSVLMAILLPFFPHNGFAFSESALWGIVGLILISTIGSFLAFNQGAKYVDSSLAAIICCFEPIITIIFEILFLGGHYTTRQLIGIIMIPIGISLPLFLSKKSSKNTILI